MRGTDGLVIYPDDKDAACGVCESRRSSRSSTSEPKGRAVESVCAALRERPTRTARLTVLGRSEVRFLSQSTTAGQFGVVVRKRLTDLADRVG